jgi:hypothetical protein
MNEDQHLSFQHTILLGSYTGLAGYILSGPVAVFIVLMTFPQPPWKSGAAFVVNYHPIQNLPYFLGFALITGMLIFSIGHYMNAGHMPGKVKIRLLLALALTSIFFGLVSFNYICQTVFIHHMASHYRPEYESLITGFSMSNPTSICWALEMWGYAILGVATWLTASYYREKNQLIRWLLTINGVVSIGSMIWTMLDYNWILKPIGFNLYIVWNLLMIMAMVAIIRYTISAKKRTENMITTIPDTSI